MATMPHNVESPADEGWREFGLDDLHPSEQQATSALTAEVTAQAAEISPPRRRGRPRRADRVLPPRRPGVAMPENPRAAAPSQPPERASPVPPHTAPGDEPAGIADDEAQLRQLWRQLHPHGRRAVLSYIAEQLVIQPE